MHMGALPTHPTLLYTVQVGYGVGVTGSIRIIYPGFAGQVASAAVVGGGWCVWHVGTPSCLTGMLKI